MDKEYKQHESYGMVSFSRMTSSGTVPLFGSTVDCRNLISLKIMTASKKNDYGSPWYHGEKGIIEVWLSQNQFAELLTGMNIGDGVPCTIKRLDGKRTEEPPLSNIRKEADDYLDKTTDDLFSRLGDLKILAESIQKKKSVSKKDFEKLMFEIGIFEDHAKGNLPFAVKQFEKAMDKAVVEAKSEIDATVSHVVTTMGMKALGIEQNTPQITGVEDEQNSH